MAAASAEPVVTNRGPNAPLTAWLALGTILIVSIYALIDRQIFVLLAEAVRTALALNDTQLGLVQGVGLALVGLVTTYPVAWLADRYDRRRVAALCVVVWSMAVVGCGLAPNFTWLFIGASLVGIGEAGLGPATFAMIPDLFPLHQRQLANSIFAAASRALGAGGVYLAGQLVALVQANRSHLPASWAALPDWRLAFVAAALFMPVAVVMLLAMPARVARTAVAKPGPAVDAEPATGEPLLAFLRRHAYAHFGFQAGALLMAFGYGATAQWIPISAQRYFHQSPADSATWLSSVGLGASVIGFAIGTPLVSWLQPRLGLRMPIVVLAATTLAAAACTLPIAFGHGVEQLYLLWGFQIALSMVASMVLPTVLQNMTPVHLRARIFAVMTLISLVAYGLSPVTVGFVSDHLIGGTRPLVGAAVAVAVATLSLSGLIFERIRAPYLRLAREVAL